ncbi:RagB/SusD family nutrient uptake outer membrane protein [Nafulsella turpanensis]|uniref:RagB/SusD family nutrient uptake outer membrane protein n=1 Tax=Nafulsella turpanensis TaxID=1265690 RepID=UPI00135F16D2|nr:RagB/SusD family nutrient uptake outer membrane protein [Nafulsella turpanensis]
MIDSFNMRKFIKSIGILTAIAILGTGCEKIIEEPAPKGVLAEGLSSPEITEGLVTAAYHALSANVINPANAFTGPVTNWVMDVRSDDAYTGGEGAAAVEYSGVPQMERGVIFPSDPESDGLHVPLSKWRNNVIGIARVNRAISSIKALEAEDYPKQTRLGEMHLLRGHFHFLLKRDFNRIPFLTEEDNPSEVSNTEYTSEELWGLIEEDLLFAYENLPGPGEIEDGRVNKYTAAAYLTKLYVQTEQWQKAIEMANVVMSGPYSLLPEFEDLATIEGENGPEVLFAIQFSRGNAQLNGAVFPNHNWSNLLNGPRGPYTGDGFYLASQNLANVFRTSEEGLPLFDTFNNDIVTGADYTEPLDPRIDFTFGRIGIPWKDAGVFDETWIRNSTFFPEGRSGKKHILSPNDPAINAPGTGPHAASGLNYIYIRYADVLLWKAEALIESGGSLEEARDLINQVRSRAINSTYVQKLDGSGDAANYVISTYDTPFPNQQYAREALRTERRLEFAMEGHRYYDLVRWGIVEEVMDRYFEVEVERAPHLEGEVLDFNGNQIYLPIPQEEIDLAPELYSQIDGY